MSGEDRWDVDLKTWRSHKGLKGTDCIVVMRVLLLAGAEPK